MPTNLPVPDCKLPPVFRFGTNDDADSDSCISFKTARRLAIHVFGLDGPTLAESSQFLRICADTTYASYFLGDARQIAEILGSDIEGPISFEGFETDEQDLREATKAFFTKIGLDVEV